MVYSYTQISQYLRCPRSYRYRYLDGWRKKKTRGLWLLAAVLRMLSELTSGKRTVRGAFQGMGGAIRDAPFEWEKGADLGSVGASGSPSAAEIRAGRSGSHPQVRSIISRSNFFQTLPGSDFVAYIDAIGAVDGMRCLIDWKTTTSRYPEGPEGLLSLYPQLICYSWITGIPEGAWLFSSKAASRDSIFEGNDL